MRRLAWIGIGMVVLGVPVEAAGQGLVPVRRNTIGIGGAVMQPTGEFQQFVRWGGGLDGSFVAGLNRDGTVGVRVQGGVLWYGHEHYDLWLGPRVPYASARVSTDNLIGSVGVGPQLTFGTGPIRPYGYGLAGFSYFWTTSSVSGDYGDWYESAVNFDDLRFSLTAGGGLLFRLTGSRNPISLDMGAQWTHNGYTYYLREGSLVERPDGSLMVLPILSEANHWTFRLGVVFGI